MAMARTSITMLNRTDESGYPCFVPKFSRKAFSYSLLSVMLAVGLSEMAFITLRYVLTILTLVRVFF